MGTQLDQGVEEEKIDEENFGSDQVLITLKLQEEDGRDEEKRETPDSSFMTAEEDGDGIEKRETPFDNSSYSVTSLTTARRAKYNNERSNNHYKILGGGLIHQSIEHEQALTGDFDVQNQRVVASNEEAEPNPAGNRSESDSFIILYDPDL